MKNLTNNFWESRLISDFFFYVMSIILWFLFFEYGNPQYNSQDWPCIKSWLEIIKYGLANNQIPYYASSFLTEYKTGIYEWGNKFFAIPYVITSPHIILLKFFSVKTFFFIHFLVTFSLAFIFYRKWCDYLKLKLLSRFFIFLLFFYSGPLVGRLSVGHLQLVSYMLIPGYLYLLMRLKNSYVKNLISSFREFGIPISLLLAFAGMQASWHVVQQFIIVGIVFFIFDLEKIKVFLISVLSGFLLLAPILAPVFIFSPYLKDEHRFYQLGLILEIIKGNSSPTINSFISFFNSIANVFLGLISKFNASIDNSWEQTFYVGFSGLIIIIFCIYSNYRKKYIQIQKEYLLAIFFLSLLSLGVMSKLHILVGHFLYVPAVDRVSARLLIYPFFTLIIFSSKILEEVSIKNSKITKLNLMLISCMAYEIIINFSNWFVINTEKYSIERIGLISYAHIYPPEITIGRSLDYEFLINIFLPFGTLVNVLIFYLTFRVVLALKK